MIIDTSTVHINGIGLNGIRVYHKPSGITVESNKNTSQYMNKQLSLEELERKVTLWEYETWDEKGTPPIGLKVVMFFVNSKNHKREGHVLAKDGEYLWVIDNTGNRHTVREDAILFRKIDFNRKDKEKALVSLLEDNTALTEKERLEVVSTILDDGWSK